MEKCRLSKTEDGSCVCYLKRHCTTDTLKGFNFSIGSTIEQSFEVCPYPSKNLPVKSEWDERAERACCIYEERCTIVAYPSALDAFKTALRAEGFK